MKDAKAFLQHKAAMWTIHGKLEKNNNGCALVCFKMKL